MAEKGLNFMKMARNDWKWLEKDGKTREWLEWLKMTESA